MMRTSLFKPLGFLTFFIFFAAAGVAAGEPPPSPLTLQDAFNAALKHSEDVAIQKEILTQTQELESQSHSGFLPTVQGTLPLDTEFHRWGNSSASGPSTYGKLSLSQPLFQGFRSLALLNQRKALTSVQKFQVQEVQRQLLLDVATAYYTVLSNQSDETNYQNEIAANHQRLKELRDFLKIGKAQESDLLTFEANIATLEAQIENVRGQLEISKQNLAYLTGWGANFILADTAQTDPVNEDLKTYLETLNQRPDILAAKAQVHAANEGIDVASGQNWPSLDLQADYSFQGPRDSNPGGSTDAQLMLTIPLYEGGSFNSQVRQAKALSRQRALELEKVIRIAETQVQTTYFAFRSSQNQIEKYEKAVAASERNYKVMGVNYRRGNVTNLEVLQALTTYQASQRTLERQKILAKLNLSTLKVVSGALPISVGVNK